MILLKLGKVKINHLEMTNQIDKKISTGVCTHRDKSQYKPVHNLTSQNDLCDIFCQQISLHPFYVLCLRASVPQSMMNLLDLSEVCGKNENAVALVLSRRHLANFLMSHMFIIFISIEQAIIIIQ